MTGANATKFSSFHSNTMADIASSEQEEQSAEVIASSYRNYEKEAHELVAKLIESSLQRLIREQSQQSTQNKESGTDNQLPPVTWPRGDEFTVEKGQEAIDALVKGWKVGPSWKYCIDFLSQRDSTYCYAVKWSEPTRRKPVPRATASVYFYLLIHNLDSPVLVMYVLEGQRLVHRPDQTVFHEVWLRNTVENKLAINRAASLALCA